MKNTFCIDTVLNSTLPKNGLKCLVALTPSIVLNLGYEINGLVTFNYNLREFNIYDLALGSHLNC